MGSEVFGLTESVLDGRKEQYNTASTIGEFYVS